MIGFINVYKPTNVTSNFVVQKIKKHFGLKKIGHMGTLDPMASGILPIAVGKATRLFNYMLEKIKTYNVEYEFGYETDTLDVTGEKIIENGSIPSLADIEEIIPSLIGKMDQVPPKFSAKNVNGVRAYDLARKGIDFELKPKEIEIIDIKILSYQDKKLSLTITCSSGTYIRAVGRDLAYKLNTYATMTKLERSKAGFFEINNSINLDDLLCVQSLQNIIISPLEVFANYDKIELNNQQYIDLKNGKNIDYNYLKNNVILLFEKEIIGICNAGKNYLKLDTYLEE